MVRSPRGRLALGILIGLSATTLTACSSRGRLAGGPPPDYLPALRADYLASHPDGPYNEYIRRGEVVPGMDLIEVLASWGYPLRRARRNDLSEQWVYRDRDEDSKDWIEYTFVFRQGRLESWRIRRHTAAGGALVSGGGTNEALSRSGPPARKRLRGD